MREKEIVARRRCRLKKDTSLKQFLSWILVLALAFQTFLPYTSVKAEAEDKAVTQEAQVIDVTDYGADPSGQRDSVIPIRKAIEAAKQVEGPVILNFPKGEYNLWQDDATVRRIYISNSTTPSESDYEENAVRTIAILLEDMDNVTIEGNDSDLIFHGKMMSIVMIGCTNMKIQNLNYDYATHYVVDLTVESVTENSAVVYVPDSYDYEIQDKNVVIYGERSPQTGEYYWTRPNHPYGQINEMLTGEIYRTGAGKLFDNVTSIEDLGNRRLRFNYSQAPQVEPGYNVQYKETIRDNPSIFIWESDTVELKNMEIGNLHSFGIVGQLSKNITVDNVKVIADDRKGVLTAASADMMQMSGCGGKITVKNCEFRNPQDDPINIHGTFLQIQEILADNKVVVRYMERETYGFPNYYVGDEVEFISRIDLNAVGESAVVTDVENPDEDDYNKENRKLITLTFDKDLPEEILNGTYSNYVVENITYTPEVEIRDCIFDQSPVRGILCTTRRKVLIENCVFRNINMSSIFISDDANSWYESSAFRDVTIKDNVFELCNTASINIGPVLKQPDRNRPLHQNLVIEGNTFFLKDVSAVTITSVENVAIKNNTFCTAEDAVTIDLESANTNLKVGDSTKLNLDVTSPEHNAALFQLAYSKNVQISGNTYGAGLNLSTATSNMDESEVTIENDEALLNQDNKKYGYLDGSTVQWYSTNPECAQIDRNNRVIYGIGAGTTEVYAVVTTADGQRWESNRIPVTVSEGSAEQEIAVTAEKDILTQAGETAVFTAEKNGSAAEVRWSVHDVSTGKESTVATISEDGVLTAVCNGLAEVRATDAEGNQGSSLIRIVLDGLTWTANIINEVAGQLTLDSANSVTQNVSSKWGFFDARNQQESLITYPIADGRNFEATVKFTGTMKNTYEENGIGILKDVDNYVAVQKKNHLGLLLIPEVNAKGSENIKINTKPNEAYFKIVKSGDTFTGYYRLPDTEEWTQIGTVENKNVGDDGLYLALWAAGEDGQANTVVWSDLTINGVAQPFGYVNEVPQAADVTLTADKVETGQTVTASYSFSDPNGDEEGDSLVLWYVSDTADGAYTRINGAVGSQFTLWETQEGKYIKAEVIPVDESGAPGESVFSEAMGPVEAGEASGETGGLPETAGMNAWLSELDIQGVSLSPSFSYDNLSYIGGVTADVEHTALNIRTQDEAAAMKVTVNDEVLAEQGNAFGDQITLLAGFNRIQIDVASEDGSVTRTYKVIVIRNGYTDSTLSGIKVNGRAIEGFDPAVTEYELTDAEAGALTLEAETANARAAVVISNGKETVKNGVFATEAEPGCNTFTIAVTSESKAESTYYTVRVKVPKSDNAQLESIQMDHAKLSDAFRPVQTEYEGAAWSKSVSLKLKAEEPGATLAVRAAGEVLFSEGNEMSCELPVYLGMNEIKVSVTAPDGTQKAYIFNIRGDKYVYLSDRPWESAESGWAGYLVRRDKNILRGLIALKVDGTNTQFEKGLGTHAYSEIVYDIAGLGYTAFTAKAGVDASRNGSGEVQFRVLLDGEEVYASEALTSNDDAADINIDISEAETLTLVADSVGSNSSDHANWADAKFTTAMAVNPVEAESEDVAESKRAMLQSAYETYKDMNTSGYPEESVKALKEALAKAEQIMGMEDATGRECEAAANAILKAGAALNLAVADAAQAAADAAQAAADQAKAQAAQAEEDAKEAQAKADAAVAKAEAAMEAAKAAQSQSGADKEAAEQAAQNAKTAQAAAEQAKRDAETAKAQAETAKTAAETAKTGAETAKAAAEAAKEAAAGSATDAADAKAKAEAAKAAAEAAKAEAESARDLAADASEAAEAAKEAAATQAALAEAAKTAAELSAEKAEAAAMRAETAADRAEAAQKAAKEAKRQVEDAKKEAMAAKERAEELAKQLENFTANEAFKNTKVKIVSAKSKKKKTAKITWKKVDGAEGYVIQYAVKKNFKGAKKLAVKKAAAVKVTLRKLKSGKNYFVRVSGYKTVNGAKIYTKTSTPKRVRIR